MLEVLSVLGIRLTVRRALEMPRGNLSLCLKGRHGGDRSKGAAQAAGAAAWKRSWHRQAGYKIIVLR